MPRINLLPWREAERKKRQRDFGVAMAGGVVAAIAVVLLTMFAYSQMISAQEARNARLTSEIKELEKSITEIDGLERQKERLLARMEIIEQLQKSRPEIVHLFDEIARQLPEGVYLTGLKQ
ncbi:MAG: pilus assembly protein PilN, partial [Gammaproteobacteria bacterium]|nr:pilus assembly protein PilN [Gammaproteobacteria bacterium]